MNPVVLDARQPGPGGLAPAFAAARSRLGLVACLFVLAGVGWWLTADRMDGMDDGPWTGLGTLGWFLASWIVMMGAMMFPSVAPTVALYARMTRARAPGAPWLFTAGYLLMWGAVGALAFGVAAAGATLLAAAVYELTPLKDVCLGRCRSPLGTLLTSWRDGLTGALRMGAGHGAWCIGCCWALMASLFALGLMSVAWMAFVAAIIAAEKTLPWRPVATYGAASLLAVLGLLLLVAPDAIPGLTVPSRDAMPAIGDMA
jgi:predicted metal-binding membrane protein